MSSFEATKETLRLPRSDTCLGWHCLNSATRFGIIFSIVVAVIILSIVWMYCAGRARIFRIKTKTNHASRVQRERRYQFTRKGTAKPTPYSVPQNFVFGNGMPPNFPGYYLPAPQVLPAQPFGVIGAHNAQIHTMAPTSLPQGTQYPTYPGVTAPELPKTKDSRTEPSRTPDECSSSHPTWWQRFYRAFNLPAGAASTIASSPSPSPEPEQRAIIRIEHSTTDRRLENTMPQFDNHVDEGIFETTATEQDDASSMLCNLDASNDSKESIRSDAATVHSDDFEVNPRRR
ncbi:hypothetical protein TRIATDRAFT_281647 [Trichoderma atroviride IMI 206040]|uniref:Uncharacterized protein n=1 Tax=Hypocrea atroviridis (strain ATCC 20476 / IMI 206040) TaxID=452589 RepID=G9NLX3_HYPAI|nr:uncharacterized protein TRIATDRAFT_281647 [Trichoderma atroviride IMI 206040]EHK47908.1 hypothetical protein TRIATDRAFT_281647 [Trichoderma atroviride IMI 206040]